MEIGRGQRGRDGDRERAEGQGWRLGREEQGWR
jgi:hypothetical protein